MGDPDANDLIRLVLANPFKKIQFRKWMNTASGDHDFITQCLHCIKKQSPQIIESI